MLRAFHLRKEVKAGDYRNTINLMGLPLDCILIEGQWFFNVTDYLELFYATTKKTANAASSRYYLWRRRFDDKLAPVYGKVVATNCCYYGDLDYLGVITRSLKLVIDNGSLFTPAHAVKLEHEDGLVAIYRGTAKAPDPVKDSNAGFMWSDFYEVKHNTLVCAPSKRTNTDDVNVPINATPKPVNNTGGIVKPSEEEAEDMPEVIKVNHPINKEDVRRETLFTPKGKGGISTVADVGSILSQLARGKKVKLTLTIELE